MKIFITGATGFIGYMLAKKCHQLGHEVCVTGQVNNTFESFRASDLRESGVKLHETPISDYRAMNLLIKGSDQAYHLAAAQHEANVSDQYFRDINVTGTENFLRACKENAVRQVVLASTIGVFGSALTGAIDDTSKPDPQNIYEVTKLEAEQLADKYRGDMSITIARISETYGPGDGRLLKLFKAIKNRTFFVIGNGENIHQLIYVDDLVEGLMIAASRELSQAGPIIFAGNERLPTTQMCSDIAKAVGTSLRGFRAPIFPFSVAAHSLEFICKPLGIQPPLHPRRLDFFRKSFYFDSSTARDLLGFEPRTTFLDGAEKTAKWYSENGML